MADLERRVAGIRCREVLAELSDYLDGSLAAEREAQIDEHLAGCSWCERLGGDVAQALGRLRHHLGDAGPLDPEIAARLRARLKEL